MADAISITITNLPQIRAAFKRAPGAMTSELNLAIKKSIFAIQSQSIKNAPLRLGGLRASILRGATFGNLKGTIFPNINYAYYVHEGTGIYVGHKPYYANIPDVGWRYMKGMKPRPFLRDAVESEQRDVDGFFKDAVQNVLDDIGRRV